MSLTFYGLNKWGNTKMKDSTTEHSETKASIQFERDGQLNELFNDISKIIL